MDDPQISPEFLVFSLDPSRNGGNQGPAVASSGGLGKSRSRIRMQTLLDDLEHILTHPVQIEPANHQKCYD